MVLGLAVGAAAAGGGGLFDYNRKNFMYDRKMRQESEYQIMELRIKQAELWREDVRDIIGLTSVKMDTYLVVNAVQLGFCVMMFCEGRLAAGTPAWLIGCHTLSLAGAFMYLLMSVWLSMHAAVSAKSYEVRILTQLVRLPVPSWTQLEGARTYGSAFEKVQTKQMFRVPFLFGTQEDVRRRSVPAGPPAPLQPAITATGGFGENNDGMYATDGGSSTAQPTSQTADPWGLEGRGDGLYELDNQLQTDPRKARHVQMVQEAMQHWQSYDAFARVSMSMGTNQLICALSYYVLGYVLVSNHGVIASWLAVALFMGISVAIIRLDMSLSAFEFQVSVLLVVLGPFLSAFATEQWTRHDASAHLLVQIISPIVFLVHFAWFVWVLQIIKVSEQQKGGMSLPTGFRSILYLDVFGWIKRKPTTTQPQALPAPAGVASPSSPWVAGTGPAVQAVRYEKGRPVPMRPEELAGAAQIPRAQGTGGAIFDPHTFVPRERGEATPEAGAGGGRAPGSTPWLVFHGATVLLGTLWFLSSGFVLLDSMGVTVLRVQPLLRESVEEEMSNRGWFLQMSPQLTGGESLVTTWPHANVRPKGLACDSATQTLASVSRFGLYVAHLDTGHVQFDAAPSCGAVEGESLQDVALRCGDEGSANGAACRALVLHRQGQRLASCTLGGADSAGSNLVSDGAAVADEWLTEDMDDEPTPEEVRSLAFGTSCQGGGHDCAYVETSARRIVEVQKSSAEEAGGEAQKWFPTRVLQARASESVEEGGGALHLINGKYLGVLLRDKKSLEVLDPSQGGMVVGRWMLPQDKSWDLMCSSGNEIYFLDQGPSPQLWRFPLPQELSDEKSSVPTPKRIQMTSGVVEEIPPSKWMRNSLQNGRNGHSVLSSK